MIFAPWCKFCKMAMPTFEEVAAPIRAAGLHPAFINCDDSKILCNWFTIRSLPTFILLNADGSFHRHKGKRDRQDLIDWALGGFKSEEKEILPPRPSEFQRLLKVTKLQIERVIDMGIKSPRFGIAVIVILILSTVVSSYFGYWIAKKFEAMRDRKLAAAANRQVAPQAQPESSAAQSDDQTAPSAGKQKTD
eukprot:TRINITY_DN7361_c0_g1_i1.p1 TRINITY_DN7361_c0_g1~~TRINITY_DN7361_c0_g1_i1.p1  ORF type:complete len:192 (-),score=48.51 TRINITY_DN7361_c0_g1_i1:115-690(-)